ncbi:MAG: DNA-methyltransferase [Bacilli bacterium]|jgi:DNA modification methylase
MKVNTIIEGDSLFVLKDLSSNSIDIIITSPPYNAAHNYDNYNDNQEFNKYLQNMEEIFLECYRVLKKGGRICVNVPFAIKNKETKNVIFLAHNIAQILQNLGFINFELISWHKGKSLNHFQGNNTAWGSWKSPSCPSFRPLSESILVFCKESIKHIGNKEDIDITSDEFKEWTKNTWYFNEETNNGFENIICIPNGSGKKEHPTPYPIELVERLLKIYSYKNDIVLDPFNGIGTTTVVASMLKRKYIGIDLSEKYCKIALNRIIENKPFYLVYNYDLGKLVNTSTIKNTLNEFFPYKESFSPHLVPYLIDRYKIKQYNSLLDPFLGTGSVFLNTSINNCYGFDTSKLAIEISLAKLIKLNPKEIKDVKNKIKLFEKKNILEYKYPQWKPYSKYVSKDKYNFIMTFINYFEEFSYDIQRFIKFVIISNLDKVFDYKRDGNGIKHRVSKLNYDETIEYIQTLLLKSLNQKLSFDKTNEKKIYFYNESSVNKKCNQKIDLVVTSPPYVNMFDYFEVYKIELWTSGIVNSYLEWKMMKKRALRNNKNSKIDEKDIIKNKTLKSITEALKEKGVNLSTITMVNNYFFDMKKVMENIFQCLKNNSYLFIIVGNSFYSNVPIKTDEILIEEAEKIGFKFEELIITRKLSTSSQQMKTIKEEDKIYMRESVLVLKKGENNEEKS